MQTVFGEIKQMQYLAVPMGFVLHRPTNLLNLNSIALQITTFDLLPHGEIYAVVYNHTETTAASEELESLGLDNKNFLLNSGTLFLTMQA